MDLNCQPCRMYYLFQNLSIIKMQRIENYWNFVWAHWAYYYKGQFQVLENFRVLDRYAYAAHLKVLLYPTMHIIVRLDYMHCCFSPTKLSTHV
jgi:hypothetical protein